MTAEPRDRFDLVPSHAAEMAFLDALDRGRLHHAWLLTGVEGGGKATFAYRAARRLLGARPDPSRGLLGASPGDPVSQLVTAQSHPDLLVLERAVDSAGKAKKSISVEQARDLPEFFSKSPSQAAYRVAIIDAVDDLNVNAANALLKTLEEPPERGVLFLVSHAPGRLLATIRSRCRRLAFPAWSEPALVDLLSRRTALDGEAAERAARMAAGSPGAALRLADDRVQEIDALARSWVEGAGDRAERLAIADGFRGAEGQARFEGVMDRLVAAVRDRALASEAGEGARWADLWSRLQDLPERAAGLNMDRADVLAGALADIDRTREAA